jgi:hypothetical protein
MPLQTILILALAGTLGTIVVHALTSGPPASSDEWKIYREWLTIVVLLVTAGAAIYQGAVMADQARTMNRQLDEMKSASLQTDKIIQSYADFATASKATALAEQQNAETARSSLLMNQRANIIFNAARIKPLIVARGAALTIVITNQGKENASFDRITFPQLWASSAWSSGTSKAFYARLADECRSVMNISGSAIAFSGVRMAVEMDTFRDSPNASQRIVVDDNLIKGDSVLAIYTCISYRTLDTIHHSGECYFYRAGFTADLDTLTVCESGHVSD